MKCFETRHSCVFAGCWNHAVYGNYDIDDNYCYTHMMEAMKEYHNGKDWKHCGWFKERCRRKLHTTKEYHKMLKEWAEKAIEPPKGGCSRAATPHSTEGKQ